MAMFFMDEILAPFNILILRILDLDYMIGSTHPSSKIKSSNKVNKASKWSPLPLGFKKINTLILLEAIWV